MNDGLFLHVGRAPPSNIQAEQALLGAILANNAAFARCGGLLPEHFADSVHALIFGACKRRIEAGRAVDAVSLKTAFETTGMLADVGGADYLAKLLGAMVAISTATEYATVIRDAALRRNLLTIADTLRAEAYGTDPAIDATAVAAQARDAIEAAVAEAGVIGTSTMGAAVAAALDLAGKAEHGDAGALGLMTGIPSLDALWCGMHPGDLDIIGARPGEGKTSLALQIVRHVARQCRDEGLGSVGLFSLEMSERQIGTVNLASLSGISADNIRAGRFDAAGATRLIEAQRDLASLPIHLITTKNLPLAELLSQMRTLRRTKGLRLAVIDRRELIGRDAAQARMGEADAMRHVTERLAAAAGSLDIPVVCLAQLRRDSEDREDTRPRKSDLRQAGEDDASNIVLLHRPELHMGERPPVTLRNAEAQAKAVAEWNDRREAAKGICEVILAKRRFGPAGMVRLRFMGATTTLCDLDPEATPDDWRLGL